MRLSQLWFGMCALVCLMPFALVANAAEFSPALDYELSQSKSTDYVSAIVILESPVDIRALDDKLHAEKATKARRHAEVLAALHYNAETTQPRFRAELDQAKADGVMKGYTAYWIENLFVIYATKDFIEGLRSRGDVKYVTENFKPELIEPVNVSEGRAPRNPLDTRTIPPGIVAVGALRVNEELGITGNGVLIGSCDTGVMLNHVALQSRWQGNFAPWWQAWRDDINHNTQVPSDGYGHGTHTVGTMTGRAVSGTDTVWTGCAPAAHWMCTNAINQGTGSDFDNDVIADYQWFTDPDTVTHNPAAVPDVVQNSWGVNANFSGYSMCFDYWNTVVLNCEAGGTVITWSAGNEGPGAQTLRAPAIHEINSYQFFAVAAVNATSYSWPYPIAGFSSRGPSGCAPNPNAIKPEIAAPGVSVYSTYNTGGYTNMDGTSMAGPHIAGVVALMREACPDCDPLTIKTALMNTARDEGNVGPDNTYGYGFVDAYAAVIAVSNLGRIGGVVTDAASNPIPGATVRNVNGSQTTVTDATGHYYLPLSSGTYTVGYSKTGYVSQDIAGLVVVQGDTTVQNVTLIAMGRVMGTVRDANTNSGLAATVQVVGGTESATASASGAYLLYLEGDSTYTLRYSMMGYTSQDHAVQVFYNDTSYQDANLVPRPVVTVLSENFEGGAPGWTHATPGGQWVDQWNINTQRSHSPTQAYKCGDVGTANYGNFDDSRLTSPVMTNLPEGSTLHFWHQIEAELSAAYTDSAYDGGIIEVAVNGGAFTEIIPVGGYNKTFRWLRGGTNPATGPILGLPCFSGSITTWTEVVADLSAYAGQSVQVRFRFGSDQSTGLAGWFVDDVTVVGYGPGELPAPASVVIAVDGDNIILSWAAGANTSYRIYSDTDPMGSYSTPVGTSNTTNFTVVGAVPNSAKTFYVVRGWDGN